MNLFLVASGRGYGVLKDNKTGKDTFMCVASLGTGIGMGVKDLRVVFVFNDAKVMQQFVEQGVEFGGKGDASAKYKDTGVSAEAGPRPTWTLRTAQWLPGQPPIAEPPPRRIRPPPPLRPPAAWKSINSPKAAYRSRLPSRHQVLEGFETEPVTNTHNNTNENLAPMKNLTHCLIATAVLTLGTMTTFAQSTPTPQEPDDLHAVLETLRSDVNAFKIRTLNQALQLTGPEAEKFWPVYRQYEKELAAVAEKKIALLREFGEHCANGTLDDRAADTMAKQWLKNVQSRLDLWKKYYKKIAKAVSPARAAQFLQVEHQMALFMDLNIAAEMPALRAVIKTGKP